MIRLLASLCLASAAALSASAQTATPPPPPQASPAHNNAVAADLPAGPGKAILQKTCAACHSLDVVTSKRATPENWSSTVQLMVSRGAEATDDEVDVLVKYLSTNFPEKSEKSDKPAAAPSGAPSSRLVTPGLVAPRFFTELASNERPRS